MFLTMYYKCHTTEVTTGLLKEHIHFYTTSEGTAKSRNEKAESKLQIGHFCGPPFLLFDT